MEKYIELSHFWGTLVLLSLYLLLAILLFRKKENGIGGLNRMIAHIARFALLLVYLSGMFLSVTLGRIVHVAHHVISALPILVLVGHRYLPERFKSENSNRTFAWIFAVLFLLVLVTAVTSRLNILPKI